jgi:hypothetical protein
MMWRPCIGRSRRSGRLSTGPIRSGLVSMFRSAGPLAASLSRARCMHGLRSPRGAQVRVVWMKDTRRNPDGGGLLVSQPPVDLNVPSRHCPPGHPAINASRPAVGAPTSVGSPDRRQSVDASAGTGCRSGGRSGCTDSPGAASTPSPGGSRSAAANHARFGVRRPITASMPANRREQAIAALAQLLIVQLERQRRQPDPDAHGRGRVAGSGSEQEEEP